jgi:hypothetical protein
MLARLEQQKEEVEALQGIFLTLFPEEYLPAIRQWHIWLNRYDFDLVADSLEAASEWHNKAEQDYQERVEQGQSPDRGMLKGKLDIVRYASGIMRNKAQEAAKGE